MDGIKIDVIGNVAKVIKKPSRITSGTVGLPIEYTFDEQWDGLTKVAVFKGGAIEKSVDLVADLVVPWEVLLVPGVWLSVGVYGANEDGSVAIPTIWANVLPISVGVDPEGDPSTDPTLPIWADVLRRIADVYTELDKYDPTYGVRYIEQTLTKEQKMQARNNIGAAGVSNDGKVISNGLVFSDSYGETDRYYFEGEEEQLVLSNYGISLGENISSAYKLKAEITKEQLSTITSVKLASFENWDVFHFDLEDSLLYENEHGSVYALADFGFAIVGFTAGAILQVPISETMTINIPIPSVGIFLVMPDENFSIMANNCVLILENGAITAKKYPFINNKYLDIPYTKTPDEIGYKDSGSIRMLDEYAIATGYKTEASGWVSHAEGSLTKATGATAHAEGGETEASGMCSHAEGLFTSSAGESGHAEGKLASVGVRGFKIHTIADAVSDGYAGMKDGHVIVYDANGVSAADNYAVDDILQFGPSPFKCNYCKIISLRKTTVDAGVSATYIAYERIIFDNTLEKDKLSYVWVAGKPFGEVFCTPIAAHAEGERTVASGQNSHAEGYKSLAIGSYSHGEGYMSNALGEVSHAEGHSTVAASYCAHAEGYQTTSSGHAAHSEGCATKTAANYAHAEGYLTTASGDISHAEGHYTQATGQKAHAEGDITVASGTASHAGGTGTIASEDSQTSIGKYNATDANALFIVGNGSSEDSRSNAFAVNKDGSACVGAMGETSDSVVNLGYVQTNIPWILDATTQCFYRTVDGEKEWMNPPMTVLYDGVSFNADGSIVGEYRTSERYCGKPVYTCIIDTGAGVSGSSVEKTTTVQFESNPKVVRFSGFAVNPTTTEGRAIPYVERIATDARTYWAVNIARTDENNMVIVERSHHGRSDWNVYFQMWYTKALPTWAIATTVTEE